MLLHMDAVAEFSASLGCVAYQDATTSCAHRRISVQGAAGAINLEMTTLPGSGHHRLWPDAILHLDKCDVLIAMLQMGIFYAQKIFGQYFCNRSLKMGRCSNAEVIKYAGLITVILAMTGCSSMSKQLQSGGSQQDQSASATHAEASQAEKHSGPPPGMNDRGEVVDSSKVEAGSGKSVKGIDGWEGEITGKFSPHSKFKQLRIGMSLRRVTDLIGRPTDEGSYVTGKAWIPFYFGSDTARTELVYKNEGRLIFATSAGFSTGQHLIWIINNAHEGGYR